MSDEKAEVTWLKNGEEIKPDDEKYEFVVSGKKRGLKLKSADVSDSAEFTCRTQDNNTSSASLTVKGEEGERHFEKLCYCEKIMEFFPDNPNNFPCFTSLNHILHLIQTKH